MKPHPTILLLGVALIAMGAAGTIYYEVLPGLQIKHPITGATTATINGTNGTVTAGYFVGDGSGLTGLPSGSAIPGTLVTNGASATAGSLVKFGSRLTNVVDAASADVQATLGQVYQGTNGNLTGWAGVPATSAGVQATLGQVYESTNTALKLTGGTLSGTLGFSGTSELLNLPSLTTAQKNAASAVAGSMVYDSDLGRVQAYDGSAWHSRVRLDGDTMTGALLHPDGNNTSPSIAFSGGTGTGVYRTGGGNLAFSVGGSSVGVFTTVVGLQTIGIGLGANTSPDTYITRENAAVVQLGQDAASPVVQTLKACDGLGTDKNGGSLTIEGGQSTGSGRGGAVVMRTSRTITTGSTVNSYDDRARYVPKYIDLTDNTATTLFTVSLPTTNSIGIQFVCTVIASDGTDFQSLTTPVTVDAVAKTTTITTVVAPTAAQTALAGSGGTLSVTYTVVDAGSNVLAVKATADTSYGSPTYLRAKIVMTAINGMGAGWSITEI